MFESSSIPFSSIEEALQRIKRGEMVVVVDDEHRENEGDLTLAAESVTPEAINFMATHGRGLICVALEGSLLDKLQIPLMVKENSSPFETAFCISVEARSGTTTGISAADRSRTVQTLIDPQSKAYDFVKPGHMFPLRAKPGGVLMRTGQTEASVDLARLAGCHPSGVICEIMNADGTMARLPDLIAFCQKHHLLIVTVADLVAYRLSKEPLVKYLKIETKETYWGTLQIHHFESLLDGGKHLAMVLGDLSKTSEPLVRVHLETIPDDLFNGGSLGNSFGLAMDHLQKEGAGVLVYLRRHAKTQGVIEETLVPPTSMNDKDIGVGAQILRHLGISNMRLLARKETKYSGLKGFGLSITRVEIFK
jgi:3,4-dihydroxy 2-butanone 4-phosphate synthase/GTP cyclohydrolase II